MQVRLITTERGIAENLIAPIKNQVLILKDNNSNVGSIKWDDIEVERGAVETIFEILGSLHLGDISIGVVSGVIANWMWSHLQSGTLQKPSEKIRVEVIRQHHDVTQVVRIECHSLEAMTASLSSALESENSE